MDNSSHASMKQCTKCSQLFPATLDYFYSSKGSKSSKDGLYSRCKTCVSSAHRKRPKVPDGLKYCPRCKMNYPATLDYFSLCQTRPGGLDAYCRTCKSERQIVKYAKAKEQGPKESPPPTLICKKCGEENSATEQYFCKNPQSHYGLDTLCKKCAHAIDKSNRKKRRAERYQWELAYNQTHKEQLTEYRKQWYRDGGKENVKMHTHHRRARLKEVPGTHTAKQIREQFKLQKGECYYCSCKLGGDYHLEHTFPISRVVGTGIPANDMSYLVLSCPKCNDKKGNRFPWEWPEGGRLL